MLDLKEEKQYDRLKMLGKKLHLPISEVFWTLEVFDKNGKLLQRHHQRSHSWVRNAYNAMFCRLALKNADDVTYEAGKLSYKTTAAVIEDGAGPGWIDPDDTLDADTRGYRAGGAVDTWGILVGGGTNAEDFEDIALQTQLTEGVGGGQISHVATDAHVITYAGTTLKNELIRYFNNNTGGNRDINEVGLVWLGRNPDGDFGKLFMVSRDKLGATVTVPDTGQLKVTCIIQLTYPS